MDPEQKTVESAAEHWYIWLVGLGGLGLFIWKLLQFIIWSEERIEQISANTYESRHKHTEERLIRLEEQISILQEMVKAKINHD